MTQVPDITDGFVKKRTTIVQAPIRLEGFIGKGSIKIKKPFLGILPKGKNAKISFKLKRHCQKQSHVIQVNATPGPNPVALSNQSLVVNRDNATVIKVSQACPDEKRNQRAEIQLYSCADPLCRKKDIKFGEYGPKQGMLPHRKGCPHHVGTIVLRWSAFLASVFLFFAPMAAFIKRIAALLKAVGAKTAKTTVVLARTTVILGAGAKKRLSNARTIVQNIGTRVNDAKINARMSITEEKNRLRRSLGTPYLFARKYALYALTFAVIIIAVGLLAIPNISHLKIANAIEANETVNSRIVNHENEIYQAGDIKIAAPDQMIEPGYADCKGAKIIKVGERHIAQGCVAP